MRRNDRTLTVGTADHLGVRTTYALSLSFAPSAHHPAPGGAVLLALAGAFAIVRRR